MKKIQTDPKKLGENGNTNHSPVSQKQDSPALHWTFTWNNYIQTDIEPFETYLKNSSRKYIFQEEKSESGTIHLQGYLELSKKERLSKLKKFNDKIHWEKCRNIEASIQYCQKEETRNGQIFKFGFPKEVKVYEPNLPWQLELLGRVSNDREIEWIYDPIGNTGKTCFAKYLFIKKKWPYFIGGKGNDILHILTTYVMEKGEPEVILFDFPRSLEGRISYAAIESIKNGIWSSGKYEGTCVAINCPRIIILSNWLPDRSELSADRWWIREIAEGSLRAPAAPD